MSSVKRAAQPVVSPKWEFKGYVKADLHKSELADFKEWSAATEGSRILDWFSAMVDDGYKVVLGENKAGLCAALHNVSGAEESRGFILTAFARDVCQASSLLMYKHCIKLDGSWPLSDEEGFDLR
jgi:hypothetical protein